MSLAGRNNQDVERWRCYNIENKREKRRREEKRREREKRRESRKRDK